MKRKVDSSVEYFSGVRTQHSIERSDVVFMVIDAMEGVTKQDQSLAGMIIDSGRAIIVVVNKWDLVKKRWEEEPIDGYKNLKHFLTTYEESLRKSLFFLPNPPVLFVSALENFKVESLLETAASVEPTLDLKLPTGQLNRVIQSLFEARAPKLVGVKRFKVFYAVQTNSRPLRIRLFCNRVERLDPTYRRYLEKGLIHEFKLEGCPIWFDLVGKDRRYADEDGEGIRQSKEIQDKARIRKKGDKAFEKKHPERRAKISQKKVAHNKSRKSKKRP
jgi:GTP-binding protein